MDLDGALHTDIHDGVGFDLGRDELVAGAHHDPDRKYDRARADLAQLSIRVRSMESRSRSSLVRRTVRRDRMSRH
jgi:hypothetical protein